MMAPEISSGAFDAMSRVLALCKQRRYNTSRSVIAMPTLYVRDFPEELHRRVRSHAQKQRRSISADVAVLIDQALAQESRRERSLEALKRIADLRRSIVLPPDAVDSLTLLREDRAR